MLERDGPQESQGSLGHPSQCVPCSFYCYSMSGCVKGVQCSFCHMEHLRQGHRRRRKRTKKDESPELETGAESPKLENEDPQCPKKVEISRNKLTNIDLNTITTNVDVNKDAEIPRKIGLPPGLPPSEMTLPSTSRVFNMGDAITDLGVWSPYPGAAVSVKPLPEPPWPSIAPAPLAQDNFILPPGLHIQSQGANCKEVDTGVCPPPGLFLPPNKPSLEHALEENQRALLSLITRCNFLLQSRTLSV